MWHDFEVVYPCAMGWNQFWRSINKGKSSPDLLQQICPNIIKDKICRGHSNATFSVNLKLNYSRCWNVPLENISSKYKLYIDLNPHWPISKLQMINVYTIGAINNNWKCEKKFKRFSIQMENTERRKSKFFFIFLISNSHKVMPYCGHLCGESS